MDNNLSSDTTISYITGMIAKHLFWSVAVIGEVEILADLYRGEARTSAMPALDLAVRELLSCGEDAVEDLVGVLCVRTGDERTVY